MLVSLYSSGGSWAQDVGYQDTARCVSAPSLEEEGKDAFSLGMQLPLEQIWKQKSDGWEP